MVDRLLTQMTRKFNKHLGLKFVSQKNFQKPSNTTKQGAQMLYTIATILIVLWLLGLVSSYTINGFIHVLLVAAIIVIAVNILNNRQAL